MPGPPGLTGGDEAAMGVDGYILDTAPYRGGIYVKVLTQAGSIVPLNVTEANKAQQVKVSLAPTQNGTFAPVPVDITIKGPSLLYIKPVKPVTGVLLISVPPIGYQTGCNGVEVRACGTHASGFYNSVKNRAPIDALDAVPEPLYNYGG